MAFIVWVFIIVTVYIILNKTDFNKEELDIAVPFWVIIGIALLALNIISGLSS